MKKSVLNILLLAGLFFTIASCENRKENDSAEIAEDANDENVDDKDLKKDADFAVEVTDGALLQVQASKLALTKASSSDVKQYAQKVVDDHNNTAKELKSVAAQKDITLPDVMSEKCQKKYYSLDEKKQGEDFDKEYMDLMVKDHKDMIDKFEDESEDGNDTDLKTWAAGKISTLRSHLEEAENIQENLKEKS